jgi:hypothetical protein
MATYEGGVISINPTATDADGTTTTSAPEGGEGDNEVTVESNPHGLPAADYAVA